MSRTRSEAGSPGTADEGQEPVTPRAGGARIEVRNLTWRPYGRDRPVLRGLDLTIGPGERVLLAGPSGSGKSTLLRALAGLLLTADSGELSGTVTVDGDEPQHRAGAVGLVLQDPGAGVVAGSIARDVAFGLENTCVPRADMAPRVEAALAEVGLRMPGESPPSSLSGGESQRLALAGALVMEPHVLLLDEPTAMLDASTAATVRAVVDEVTTRRSLTLVVVEHRLDGWLDVVDRIVVLDADGRVVADGTPPNVLDLHAESLAAQGIWVPGVPEPEPLALDLPTAPQAANSIVDTGEVVASARGVSVEHRSVRLGAPARTTEAVRDADLDVRSGEVVALVGESGAGKSSLMAAVGGLVAPAAGTVTFARALHPRVTGEAPRPRTAEPVSRWRSTDLARVVSWVPQRAATAIVGRTVREDVLTTPVALGHSGGDSAAGVQADARADALLGALRLDHLAGTDPRHLSGGEQRRLALAAAVAHGPALVLADEPTIGQDRLTWSAVTGVLVAARREGSAVLVTTHDPGVVARAERVVQVTRPVPTDDGAEQPITPPLVARAGPLALLVVALSVLPLPALLESWRQGLAVLVVELVLGTVGLLAPGPGAPPRHRVRGFLVRLAPAGLAVLGVAWSAWLLGGRDVEVAFGAALRVLCLVVPSAFVSGYIDPERLGDHLAQRLRLPARPVVAATAALQRFQSFATSWTELMTTRRVRGIRADRGVVACTREAVVVSGGLLVAAVGQAASLALAMDARGFAGARRRTWAGAAPWRLADNLALAAGLVVVASGAAAHVVIAG